MFLIKSKVPDIIVPLIIIPKTNCTKYISFNVIFSGVTKYPLIPMLKKSKER